MKTDVRMACAPAGIEPISLSKSSAVPVGTTAEEPSPVGAAATKLARDKDDARVARIRREELADARMIGRGCGLKS